MRFLIIMLGICGFAVRSWAACTAPAGVAGEIRYNADHKVMQFCDNANWIAMGASQQAGVQDGDKGDVVVSGVGSVWAVKAAGATGAVQFKGADGTLAGSTGLSFNDAARSLNILGGNQAADLVPILAVSNSGTGRISFKAEHMGSNFIVRPLSAGSASTVIENTGGGDLLINPSVGRVGIHTAAPGERLEVNGNIKIAAGGALKMDVIRVQVSPLDTPVISPSGTGVTCSTVTGTQYNTRCSCPSGYMAISGGGYISGNGAGSMRENRFLDTQTWIVSCVNGSTAPVVCGGLALTCARIIAN